MLESGDGFDGRKRKLNVTGFGDGSLYEAFKGLLTVVLVFNL